MKSSEEAIIGTGGNGHSGSGATPTGSRASFCHLVTGREVEELREALDRGKPPADLEAKLFRLRSESLLSRFVQQNSRRIMDVLLAAYHGAFREARSTSMISREFCCTN